LSGIEAFSVIPNYITSNCYIAKCYAQLIHGFIKDAYLNPQVSRDTHNFLTDDDDDPTLILDPITSNTDEEAQLERASLHHRARHGHWQALVPSSTQAASEQVTPLQLISQMQK